MGHYRSNLEDLKFNLFEVHRLGDRLQHWPGMDGDVVTDILTEVERFAGEEWAESFVEADRASIELVDGEVALPPSLKDSITAAHTAGWSRLGLEEDLGGTEVPPTVFWAVQELLLGANPTAVFYFGGGLFARIIYEEGTENQRRLARLMVERDWAGTMVLTEPDAGSDVGAGTTRATHVEGETYHLAGVKRFITGGEHDAAENIIHLVLARPEGAGPGTKGLSSFVVPKYLVDDDGSLGERNGVVATNLEKKMGLRGSTTTELTFGGEKPAVGYLVGGVHDGIRQMFRVIEHARMTIGTKSAATLSTGYLNALEYARERVQGADLVRMTDKTAPRAEIIRHPDVRRMLMTQKAYAEGLRALWTYAAWTLDMAKIDPEGDWDRRNDLLLPLVKGYASEKAHELLTMSLQVLGGSGYIQDFPMEQYMRDAKIDSVYEGTTGIQAMDLFFRKVARDQGQTLAALASEIVDFVKGGGDADPLAEERTMLGRALDDTQGHVGLMVEDLMASTEGEVERVYEVGLHANALLESLAEVVIAWQLLRHAEIAYEKLDRTPFLEGKIASARFLIRDVTPKINARRAAAEAENGWLMRLDDAAF